jgi:ferredoxin
MDKRRKSEERRRLDRLERTGANNFVCIGCFGCTDHCTAERHHVGGRRMTHTANISVQISIAV